MNNIKLINQDLQDYKQSENLDIGKISDGHHTFDELYEFRKMYNAALFNEWASNWRKFEQYRKLGKKYDTIEFPKYDVHKSWKHNDGKWCFNKEKEWFIVSAKLPTGIISNHYQAKDWDLFKIPVTEKSKHKFDGHTSKDVLKRLSEL